MSTRGKYTWSAARKNEQETKTRWPRVQHSPRLEERKTPSLAEEMATALVDTSRVKTGGIAERSHSDLNTSSRGAVQKTPRRWSMSTSKRDQQQSGTQFIKQLFSKKCNESAEVQENTQVSHKNTGLNSATQLGARQGAQSNAQHGAHYQADDGAHSDTQLGAQLNTQQGAYSATQLGARN